MHKLQPFIIISILALAIGGLVLVKRFKAPSKGITIGILQTASHPALDAAREGFVKTLPHLLQKDVNFVIRNAQGDITTAHSIAQQFHNDKNIEGVFAIATPAVQAITSVETEKPIFIATVTDPHSLGIIHPTTNVCGSSDMINVTELIEAMHTLLPHVKTVAIIYNPAESNAALLTSQMKQELQQRGITPIEAGISSQADMPPAIASALNKADALLAPTDNTIATAISYIATQALKAGKPLIVSDNLLVKQGALMSRGVDYFSNGSDAAHCAAEVLSQHKKPYELPIKTSASSTIVVNKEVATQLAIEIPAHKNITLVDE